MARVVSNEKYSKYCHGLTTLRGGPLGNQRDSDRDEMYIDPSPYCSLSGFDLHKSPEQRSRDAAKNPRADVDFGNHARARSAGKKAKGGNPHHSQNPMNNRGAPPHRV